MGFTPQHPHLHVQVRQWRAAYEDADRALRAARDEVARLESSCQITDRDALYLRSVIVSGFEAGELPCTSTMFGVLARLLHFTPQEMERIQRHAGAVTGAGKGGGGYGMGLVGVLGGRRGTAAGAGSTGSGGQSPGGPGGRLGTPG